ncbi:hypothetical protein OG21DRAFT_1489854 [Imleria badia]|nr:hypothetical protein OG21DRAFT_1489854 [Imleria badia]
MVNPLHIKQLFSIADKNSNDTGTQSRSQASVPSSTNPNTIPPSTPSSFIGKPPTAVGTPAPSPSVFTSVSRTKRKLPASASDSIIESDVNVSRKRSCPESTAAMAQQAGGEAMQEIAAVVKNITRNMAPPPPPIDDLSTAMDVLNGHVELTPMQRLDISDFLAVDKPENKNQVIVFQKLDEASRKAWLNHRLSEIEISRQARGFDILTIND